MMRTQTILEPEDAARQQVEVLLQHADMPARSFPLTQDDVIQLLTELEYVDPERHLQRFLDEHRIPQAGQALWNGCWSASHVLAAVMLFEGLRLWKPGSRIHASKLSRFEISIAKARAEGRMDEVYRSCRGQSIRELLILLTSAPDRQQREGIRALLMAKLEEAGIDEYA